MKICSHCQAENPDEQMTCAACGQPLEEEAVQEEETVQVVQEPEAEEEFPLEAPEAEATQKKSHAGLIAVIILAVLLVVAVIYGKGQYDKKQAEAAAEQAAQEQQETASTSDLTAHHVNAHGYGTHSIHYTADEAGTYTYDYQTEDGSTVSLTQDEVDAMLSETIATAAGQTLTNRELAYFYDEQYYSFYQQYSSYLMFLLDTTLPLDEQPSMESNMTWQQYFVNLSLNMFQEISALYAEAQEVGFQMPAEDLAFVETMREQLETASVESGFASAEEYLKYYYGPGVTVETYLSYFEKSYYCNLYLSAIAAEVDVSEQKLVDYYNANTEMLVNNYGLEMDNRPMVNVRHILITPESTTAEDGSSSVTDEAQAAAKAEAERILAEWQAGDATEETFAALAETYSTDPGSNTSGGLYENVYPGQMVEAFDAWCFDGARQSGDTGIVETDYGYHIMFYSSTGDQIYWKNTVAELIKSDAIMEKIASLQAEYPMEADLGKAVLLTPVENTLPTEETEETTESTTAAE